jgi:hypothetical protein
MDWGVAAAKQQLSRVIKAAEDEPQLIRTRGTLVAAVLGASEAEEYLAWRSEHRRRSLGELFRDVREIEEEESFALTFPERIDRPNPLVTSARRATKREPKAKTKAQPAARGSRAR